MRSRSVAARAATTKVGDSGHGQQQFQYRATGRGLDLQRTTDALGALLHVVQATAAVVTGEAAAVVAHAGVPMSRPLTQAAWRRVQINPILPASYTASPRECTASFW